MMTRQDNYGLGRHNTFRMNVKCAAYISYDSAAELEKLDFSTLPQPVMHIGAGSNLLFTGDFPGTVLHSEIRYIKYVDMGFDEVPVMVGAGVCFDEFVANTCANGLWGAENLSLIPGEVGAAAVQNIGAYGAEVKDIISGVVCYDTLERRKVKFTVGECGYGYRESRFKGDDKGRYIVTSVLFRLSRKYSPRLDYKGVRSALGLGPDETPGDLTPQQVREAIIKVRREKLPDPEVTGSAGSFFKNPVVSAIDFAHIIDVARSRWGADATVPHFILESGFVKVPAAWMIDRCGLKGAAEGGAAVCESQPLVIINASSEATPRDVMTLEERIIGTVRDTFGITLHPEVEHI